MPDLPRGRLLGSVLAVVMAATAFLAGLWVGSVEAPPYRVLRNIVRTLRPPPAADEVSDVVGTTWVQLGRTTVNSPNVHGLAGGGGALATLDDTVLGVDRDGQFFLYTPPGQIARLGLSSPMNKTSLARDLVQRVSDSAEQQALLDRFRVLDVVLRAEGDELSVYVSHHHWRAERNGKTTRVSRLTIPGAADWPRTLATNGAGVWQTVFETTPPVELGWAPRSGTSAFGSNRSGGRMIFEDGRHLVLGLGDHKLDGVDYEQIASQDDGTSYGKLIRVDLETGEATQVAKGLRNPSGLLRDDAGQLWVTDHGAQGGDELNLVYDDANFGWPLVTYGTDYDRDHWPLAAVQGVHDGFERPVYSWVPSIGISSLAQVGARPAGWARDLLVGSLGIGNLYRLRVREGRVIFAEPIRIGSRIRDITVLSNGTILLWLDNAALVELREVESTDGN